MKSLSPIVIFLLAGVAGIAGALAGGVAVYRAVTQRQAETSSLPVQSLPLPAGESGPVLSVNTTDVQTTITQSVEKVGAAVVTVVGALPGQPVDGALAEVSGSGVFISEEGHILTNHHVVEGLDQIRVVLYDGSEQAATLVGTDPYTDLAVLRADGQPPAVAALGNSDVLNPGETVVAIGSPLGDLKNTVTVGVISATQRSIDTGRGYKIEGLIQTDAAINQGNSGGPLLNLAGEIIGINTLVVRGGANDALTEGLGFSIPANTARAVADQIIQKGHFSRPYLGIRWQPVTPDVAVLYNLPQQWGAYVTHVVPGSPAQSAGLQAGDVITRIGGAALDENNSFVNILFRHQQGERVELEIVRNGASQTVAVELGEEQAP